MIYEYSDTHKVSSLKIPSENLHEADTNPFIGQPCMPVITYTIASKIKKYIVTFDRESIVAYVIG